MIGRDKVLYKIGVDIIMEGMIGVYQEEEAYLQEGIVTGNMVILD